jgi:hypothetical protein
MPDEDHGSVVLRSHYDGLRKIFEGWKLPVDRETRAFRGGLSEVKAHYAKLSERMGYPVEPPEQTINLLGYQFLGQKAFEDALAIFRYNLELHPLSANAHDSLGEALEKAGKPAEAKEAYAKAVALGEKGQHPFLATFARNLERMSQQGK